MNNQNDHSQRKKELIQKSSKNKEKDSINKNVYTYPFSDNLSYSNKEMDKGEKTSFYLLFNEKRDKDTYLMKEEEKKNQNQSLRKINKQSCRDKIHLKVAPKIVLEAENSIFLDGLNEENCMMILEDNSGNSDNTSSIETKIDDNEDIGNCHPLETFKTFDNKEISDRLVQTMFKIKDVSNKSDDKNVSEYTNEALSITSKSFNTHKTYNKTDKTPFNISREIQNEKKVKILEFSNTQGNSKKSTEILSSDNRNRENISNTSESHDFKNSYKTKKNNSLKSSIAIGYIELSPQKTINSLDNNETTNNETSNTITTTTKNIKNFPNKTTNTDTSTSIQDKTPTKSNMLFPNTSKKELKQIVKTPFEILLAQKENKTDLLLKKTPLFPSECLLIKESTKNIGSCGVLPKQKSQTRLVCDLENCSIKISIKTKCKFCDRIFCGKHRIPEEHLCQGIEKWKKEAMNKNGEKLSSEKCKGNKI